MTTDITELAQRVKTEAAAIDDTQWYLAKPSEIRFLVEALEKAQKRITQLESRTVTLSANDIFNVPEGKNYVGGEMVYVDTIRDYLEECGIKVEGE